ncbi:hypothetical protein SELMODRAFT_426819 [Selaginella moellendorffii]|uniref:Uncharacterized protein n=1 Tax=Selaginella moellendorffii TaxID=88036 RepID=D8SXL3_SELML|nr:hypothetical protein SELMODRAFT_426819 [Selaginella moellendorffii]
MASTPWVLIMVKSRLLSVKHKRADVESIHVICLLPVQLATSAKNLGSLSQQQDGNVPEVFLLDRKSTNSMLGKFRNSVVVTTISERRSSMKVQLVNYNCVSEVAESSDLL